MPLKVFISYRRQDTAASAVGISQYLEKELGRKNVYVDVDMQAGAKYPAVIEKRLAECRVLLVLIGPDWLKLQKPNDWVQREIAYALKRDITVIPVLINGAQLPDQELLPDDIKGLVDHQAASVSLASFRHEMAGLVRDIRSIGPRKPWRLLGAIAAAALILLVTTGILVYAFGFSNLLGRIRPRASPPVSVTTTQNGIWNSRPGEWVMFAIDKAPVAYFIKSSSLKVFGDRVAYTGRYPLHANVSGASSQGTGQDTYEDQTGVMDCKKLVYGMAEKTDYNSAGEIIFHYKFGELESLDLSNGLTISAGTILALAQSLICDEKLRTLLISKAPFSNIHLSYLGNSLDDGNLLYGPLKSTSDLAYPIETLFIDKKNGDHELATLFPGQNVRGLPPAYHTAAQNLQINCAERKVLPSATGYYDRDDNLTYLVATPSTQPIDVPKGSLFDMLLDIACKASVARNYADANTASSAGNKASVAGNYAGTNTASYAGKGQGQQQISIIVQQNGSDLKLSFQAPLGGQGEGTGKLMGNRLESTLHSTAPGCPGSYDGSFSFADGSVSWSYRGTDCGGALEGHGTATKVGPSGLNR